jgi:P-type Cu2+ transporter
MSTATLSSPVSRDQAWHSFDQTAQWRAFSVQDSPGVWRSQLKVQGMHCSACAQTVEQALLAVPGVINAQVNAITGQASVLWKEEKVLPSQWMQAVATQGYGLLPIQGAQATQQLQKAQRAMLWRWLVAGFCMMQVMMYAWPSYSALPGEIDATSQHILRWASLLLTLPVMLFSCGPFFSAAWRDVRHGRISMDFPVTIGIGLTFAVSVAALIDPRVWWGDHVYFDSLTMLVFLLLSGRYLEARLKAQVASHVQSAAEQLPLTAQLQTGEQKYSTVPVHRLAEGDVILVRTGESFAADGEVIAGQSRADESLLTGESMTVIKQPGSIVVAGSVNMEAPVHVRVRHVGEHTQLGQIQLMMQQSLAGKTQVMQLADRLAQPFLWAVLLMAVIALLIWWPIYPQRGVQAAIAVLLISCPCALALAAPAAFLSTASALFRHGLLTRDLSAIERLAQVQHFAFDKTGTLTLSELQVQTMLCADRIAEEQALAIASALASQSMHPVAQAVHSYAQQELRLPLALKLEQCQEVAGQGVQGYFDSVQYRLGSLNFCGITEPQRWPPQDSAMHQVYLSDTSGWLATISLREPMRPLAAQAIRRLYSAAVKTKHGMQACEVSIVSGDQRATVLELAKRLGLNDPAYVHAPCKPGDKLAFVKQLQAQGQKVAMIGDGVNDAPVLAAADVSIAPATGAAMANVKADFVLTQSSLMPIAIAQSLAQKTVRIVRQNLAWAAVYNAVCIPFAVSGVLTPWMAGLGMAASSLFVLLNALRLQRMPE